jgi:hypothetical protein
MHHRGIGLRILLLCAGVVLFAGVATQPSGVTNLLFPDSNPSKQEAYIDTIKRDVLALNENPTPRRLVRRTS